MNNGNVMGVFIGLESATYEYIANIIAPYQTNFELEIGDFLLIENMGSYIVSRVTEYRPTGELTSFMGQKWLGDVASNLDAIGLDIKEKKIRYTVRIKILGSLHNKTFRPGVTKIPNITSKVYKPSKDQLHEIIETVNRQQSNGKEIGSLYSDKDIKIKFNISELNAKRTFVFARAGYGKSNLMKLISSDWPKNEGGLVIFDPEGEYAVTDSKKRPGIMDHREAILVTNRRVDTKLRNVYRYMKLNLREFDPKFILPIIVNPSKHETVFFSKLMGMEIDDWGRLVDLLYNKGWRADLSEVAEIVTGSDEDTNNFQPVLNNLVSPIRSLHDPDSHLMGIITEAMRRDEVVLVDISLLDSKTALQLSSMVVKWIFDHNQRNFIDQDSKLIKATFVVEEAQSVIGQDSNYASFIELAKEGRKYGLGGIFITQQPGSIPSEILSQADNFFVFHLISRSDLESLRRANAHYSDDILTQVLSEPIPGKCYMWTSFQPFVLPLTVNNFEDIVKPDRSIEIQGNSDLLTDIKAMLQNEDSDPVNASIIAKYNEVERAGIDPGQRTIELYNRLDENERSYLNEKGQIQLTKENVPFAVKTKYYNSLKK
ncbi:ATP-binding protein [Ferroplasma acidiphilum]|uniref:ATP-binding protein n=1 Tax=Ferroplasma acidiphilum TaxID=74969 RepID=A0A7K4FQ23_9ARCH|nr:ATP-binding protein [Ferroplasma acidiphilum]NOL60931.1 ATP-binding protein [Ferroplasma acidiphilum]